MKNTPFICSFNQIEKMEIVDYRDYQNIEKPKKSEKKKLNAPTIGKRYQKRSGRFWKWTLNLPKDILNLEKYQIFNTLDVDTVKSMSKEHCLVSALQQTNIPL